MRTEITSSAVELWLAELALSALRLKFPSPDYKFALEDTQHVANPTCLPHVRRVRIVCHTNFAPAAALVAAWQGRAALR